MPHALITGASRGIGLSIARTLATAGHTCTLISRSAPALQTAVSSLPPVPSHSAAHGYIPGDIASPDFWSHSGIGASLSAQHRHKINVLVNCAGITQTSLFVRTESSTIQTIVDTNLTAMMLGTRYLLKNRYFHRPPGVVKEPQEKEEENTTRCIINVASLLGMKGGEGAVAYAASKAGVLGFTRALATEVGGLGIRVNALVPGYITTEMTQGLDTPDLRRRIPLGRLGRPEEIASAALFLVRNEYAHNCVINLDGGLSAV